ncbi:MAG: hypothetical protein WB626_02700 [Bacteroidota bacterium]
MDNVSVNPRALFMAFAVLVWMPGPDGAAQIAEPETPDRVPLTESVFGLGLSAGAASGVGLSFRHHLPGPWAYQLAGGIVSVDDRLLYDIGCSASFDIGRRAGARYFAAASAGYFFSGSGGANRMRAPGRAGLGVGGEFFLTGELQAQAEVLFTYFTDGTVLPLPQAGLHYYFR